MLGERIWGWCIWGKKACRFNQGFLAEEPGWGTVQVDEYELETAGLGSDGRCLFSCLACCRLQWAAGAICHADAHAQRYVHQHTHTGSNCDADPHRYAHAHQDPNHHADSYHHTNADYHLYADYHPYANL